MRYSYKLLAEIIKKMLKKKSNFMRNFQLLNKFTSQAFYKISSLDELQQLTNFCYSLRFYTIRKSLI